LFALWKHENMKDKIVHKILGLEHSVVDVEAWFIIQVGRVILHCCCQEWLQNRCLDFKCWNSFCFGFVFLSLFIRLFFSDEYIILYNIFFYFGVIDFFFWLFFFICCPHWSYFYFIILDLNKTMSQYWVYTLNMILIQHFCDFSFRLLQLWLS